MFQIYGLASKCTKLRYHHCVATTFVICSYNNIQINYLILKYFLIVFLILYLKC